jgi:peptidoglycan/LPS O-acetylase OafA/YrhL
MDLIRKRQHFATLDGLRGVAAIVVLAFHALSPFDPSLTPHAALAVDFFFCLSGFVVGYAYESRLLSTMSFTEFVAARIIRLYPLILVGLLLGSIVYIGKTLTSHQSPFTPNFLIAVILEALMVPFPPILGKAWWELSPINPPAWSLFFEFFATFVYAIFVTRLIKPVMTVALVLGAIIVFAQAFVFDGVAGGNHWNNLWGGFGRVFFPFLCGLFLFRRWQTRPPLDGRAKLAPFVPIVLLTVLLCPAPSSVNWLYESCAVVLVFPLITSAGALDVPGPRMSALYLFLGRLSYPIYILHYPFIRLFSNFVRSHSLHGIQFWLLIAVEMLSAAGFSFAMLKFFDEPLRLWLSRKWRALHIQSQEKTHKDNVGQLP